QGSPGAQAAWYSLSAGRGRHQEGTDTHAGVSGQEPQWANTAPADRGSGVSVRESRDHLVSGGRLAAGPDGSTAACAAMAMVELRAIQPRTQHRYGPILAALAWQDSRRTRRETQRQSRQGLPGARGLGERADGARVPGR